MTPEEQIRAVLALHTPRTTFGWDVEVNACSHCERRDGWPRLWPCPTIEAIGEGVAE